MKVLLADDHRIVRDGVRWMLEAEPDIDIVAEAGDGQELLDELARGCDVDVVLLDVRMPGVGGLDALQQLASSDGSRPAPAIIILSMHQEAAVVRKAIQLGAAGYLLKSSTREQLLAALRHVAAGNCYVQAEVTGPLLDEVAGRTSVPPTPTLTKRECDVLRLIAAGYTTKRVAVCLNISEATVKTHLREIFGRLDVANRAEAVATALELGLLDQA